MNFVTSVLPAAILEIVGEGGSAIAFNWWLRAATVNNLSVVLVSDIFYSFFFGIIAIILVLRSRSKWNSAMLHRVGSVTVHRLNRQENQNYGSINNGDDDDENEEQEKRNEQPQQRRQFVPAVVDEISVSLKEVWVICKSHFFCDAGTTGWLVLAGTCDCLLSLCETYAAGHIAVITQLFLKASEPIIVWGLALKWRRREKNLTTNATTAAMMTTARKNQKTSMLSEENERESQADGEAEIGDDVQQKDDDADQQQQEEDWKSFWCSKRALLSLLSLTFVGLGITLHFVLKIKNEIDTGKSGENPAGFVMMYACSVFGSAMYAISFGRYIFLVKRFSTHTNPLDIVDLHRAVNHSRITEHHHHDNVIQPAQDSETSSNQNVNINNDEEKTNPQLQHGESENENGTQFSSAQIRVVACFLEVTIALILSLFIAPCMELMPGGVGAARSWPDLIQQTSAGIKALSSSSTMVFAIVTLLGWAFVYGADSILNHLSAPLTSLINQLASPLTAILLLIVPALDASETPEAKKLPEFSFALQLLLKIASAALVFLGSILMYFAEKNYAD